MGVVVQKYGGSSVGDLDRLGRVADRIAATRALGHQPVVVVSAMGNTTNELLALAHAVARVPDRRELDMLVSVGERVTMALLALALRERGVPARSLTGSQSGILTTDAHAEARVVEVRPARVQEALAAGEVPIVAGFQGMSLGREVTTLGRGGSDTTAVVLAAALGAEHCEICSDVDGVWSSDPRVVPGAVRFDALSSDLMWTLARSGATVLVEEAVRYARDRGITLVASSTFGGGRGTRIVAEPTPERVAVASERQWRLDAGEALPAGGRIRRISDGTAWIDPRNVHAPPPPGVTEVGVVTVVATGLGERFTAYGRGRDVLARDEVAVSGCWGSGDAVSWEVGVATMSTAVRALHEVFVAPTVS